MFGTDYATPDGTCLRDYIHVTDLVAAHSAALAYLRAGGADRTFNCGYGRGYSVLEVLDTVKRVTGLDFPVEVRGGGRVTRRQSSPAIAGSCPNWPGRPALDDLDTIVAHAFDWEKKLARRNDATG